MHLRIGRIDAEGGVHRKLCRCAVRYVGINVERFFLGSSAFDVKVYSGDGLRAEVAHFHSTGQFLIGEDEIFRHGGGDEGGVDGRPYASFHESLHAKNALLRTVGPFILPSLEIKRTGAWPAKVEDSLGGRSLPEGIAYIEPFARDGVWGCEPEVVPTLGHLGPFDRFRGEVLAGQILTDPCRELLYLQLCVHGYADGGQFIARHRGCV